MPSLSGAPVVTINGQVVTVPNVPAVPDEIGQRSTVDLQVIDQVGTLSIKRGQPVVITDGASNKIFAGWVASATQQRIAYGPATYGWVVKCIDHVYLADKRIAAATYANRTCGYIVNDLLTNYLAAEGVTAGTIQAGPTLTQWAIDYRPVSEQLDKLAELAGFYWNIDANRVLTFTAYNTTAAPFTFDGSQADDPDGNTRMTVEHTAPLYRDAQYILGITEVTSAQTETRKGDGAATTFTFNFPLHSAPSALTVNGVAKTSGIKGVDTGKDWYWSKGDPTLAQDTAGVKLLSTDTLSLTYVGEYKTLVYAQDDAQVTEQAALEGGTTSGKVQAVVTDATLVGSSQGFQKASALLSKYATSGKILTFMTLTGGLASGQLLTVNIPSAPWNISNEAFLIESVVPSFDGFVWWYTVKALSGPVNDTWVNFFKRIASTVGVVDTGSSGVSQSVTLLQSTSETWPWTESVSETVYACPLFPFTFPATLC